MINSTALNHLMKKAIQNGAETIFISNLSGEILAKEGVDSTSTITDVVSLIWTEYNEIGNVLKSEKIRSLILETDDSFIIAADLFGYIVSLKADANKNLGMLKIHLESIVKYLNEQFADFKHILQERA